MRLKDILIDLEDKTGKLKEYERVFDRLCLLEFGKRKKVIQMELEEYEEFLKKHIDEVEPF